MKKDLRFKKDGFTLVETLVAVAILMIAIAGPLTIANQALTAALGSRNAMIATYLAQDGMESIKNIKDNNVSSGTTWLDRITCSGICSTPHASNLAADVGWDIESTVCDSINNCLMYTNDSKSAYFYNGNPVNGDHATPFTRSYSIKTFGSNEAVVIVSVLWTDGSVPNAVTLQELITNTPR